MIINQEGMRYTYNGMTYTVGAAVMATEASEYRGLYGTITEIRDGADRETEMIRLTSIAVLNRLCFKRRSGSWSNASQNYINRLRSSTRSRWIWLSWHQRWFG